MVRRRHSMVTAVMLGLAALGSLAFGQVQLPWYWRALPYSTFASASGGLSLCADNGWALAKAAIRH